VLSDFLVHCLEVFLGWLGVHLLEDRPKFVVHGLVVADLAGGDLGVEPDSDAFEDRLDWVEFRRAGRDVVYLCVFLDQHRGQT
jgi:hypothetical protein